MKQFVQKLNEQTGDFKYSIPDDRAWIYIYTNGGNELNKVGWECDGDISFIKKRKRARKIGTAHDGSDAQTFLQYGWFAENSGGQPHPVGQLRPMMLNHPDTGPQPIWDMSGNVAEMVELNLWTQYDLRPRFQRYEVLGGSRQRVCFDAQSDLYVNPWDEIALGYVSWRDRDMLTSADADAWRDPDVGIRLIRQRVEDQTIGAEPHTAHEKTTRRWWRFRR